MYDDQLKSLNIIETTSVATGSKPDPFPLANCNKTSEWNPVLCVGDKSDSCKMEKKQRWNAKAASSIPYSQKYPHEKL